MKKLVLLSILLAMVVIILGAYARLTDAGLGCPDWPGCYGHLSFSQTTENIETAQQAFPDRPFEEHKAWNEMIHRYFASALGFLILVIFINSLFSKAYNKPVKLPLFSGVFSLFSRCAGHVDSDSQFTAGCGYGALIGWLYGAILFVFIVFKVNPLSNSWW